MTIKLNFKEVSLNQCIYSDSLILWLLISLSCNRKRYLALLEVKINWGKDSDNSLCWVCRIECTVSCGDVGIEITFRNTV